MKKLLLITLVFLTSSCLQMPSALEQQDSNPRLVLFVGVDISGSFLNGKYFDNAMEFLSEYIYLHMKGMGGLEIPQSLFVGTIGGVKPGEPKTFFPIQTFQNKTPAEIRKTLSEIFPKKKPNMFTDYTAFFNQVNEIITAKKLVLRPISIVMISDGVPDVKTKEGKQDFNSINLNSLENLSRNITIRLLYTDSVHGMAWSKQVKRRRVKLWTQDAIVMQQWNDPKIFIPGHPPEKQKRFTEWVKDNVDFAVRSRRVD